MLFAIIVPVARYNVKYLYFPVPIIFSKALSESKFSVQEASFAAFKSHFLSKKEKISVIFPIPSV